MAKSIKSSDDKVLYYYYKGLEYFEENKQRVYTGLIIAGIIIAGIIFYMLNKQKRNETAAVELYQVQQVYDSGNYLQAINGDSLNISKGLNYIVNEYGSTEAGETAKILLANSFYFLRDFNNAEKWYNEYDGDNKVYESAAISGLGAVYEARQNWVEAAKQFEKAGTFDEELPNNDENLFYAARNYSMAKDAENFQRVYKLMKEKYPKSTYIAQADRFKL